MGLTTMKNKSKVPTGVSEVEKLMLGLQDEKRHEQPENGISNYWDKRISKENKLKNTLNNCRS